MNQESVVYLARGNSHVLHMTSYTNSMNNHKQQYPHRGKGSGAWPKQDCSHEIWSGTVAVEGNAAEGSSIEARSTNPSAVCCT